MEGKLVIKIGILTLVLILVIGLMYHFKTTEGIDVSLLKDRNQYISKYNKKICKYNIIEIQIQKRINDNLQIAPVKILKWIDGDWVGRGDVPLDLIQKSIEEFCNIRIRNEVNLSRLKAPIDWSEDIEFVFSDKSRVQAMLSKKGIIKVGVRHYFTADLLILVEHFFP